MYEDFWVNSKQWEGKKECAHSRCPMEQTISFDRERGRELVLY
jgi:hypothetical protein